MAPIHEACIRGDMDEVKLLLANLTHDSDKLALLEQEDVDGNNAFTLAQIHKHHELYRYIYFVTDEEPYHTYDYVPDGRFHAAIKEDDTITFDALLLEGANIEALDIAGYTPLAWACEKKNAYMIRKLVEAGADVNARHHHKLCGPFHYALFYDAFIDDENEVEKRKAIDICEYLVRNGADTTHKDINGQDAFESYVEYLTICAPNRLYLCTPFATMIGNVLSDTRKELEMEKQRKNVVTTAAQEIFVQVCLGLKMMMNK